MYWVDPFSASYGYLANSPLVGQITFKQGASARMTTSKTYDNLNRLTQISSAPGGSGVPPVAFNYNYNSANQRTKDKLADGSYWVYQYDSLGQVVSGCKYFYDNTPVPGQQFDYSFDTIGNRMQTKAGGDQTGGNQRLATYLVNNLNQITSRDYPGTNDIIGAALATNSVTVNGQTAFHKGEYFWGTVNANNTASPVWLTATAASGGSSTTGNVFMPQTPEQFSYDADGNLTNDGRWSYTWDAENRLVAMTNNTGVGPLYGLTFAYDAKGRRIQKSITTDGVSFTTQSFLYDGWNLVGTLNSSFSLLNSFMWGSDLSGSPQGAGGVGGLLEVSEVSNSQITNCFAAYDGNGNLAALINAADGTSVANYEYGPFGEVIRSTGPMAKVNPIRFSTKYQDDESDLIYYGLRYLKTSTGGWLNRDPLGERGGLNLYGFVGNSALNKTDHLGQDSGDDGGTGTVNDPTPLPPPTPPATVLPRHSYLTYQVICPKCQMVDKNSVSVDYSQVSLMPPLMPTWPHNSLGGLRDVQGINCFGDPVTITAFMETRFVDPPNPWASYNVGQYQSNTHINYSCVSCQFKWLSF